MSKLFAKTSLIFYQISKLWRKYMFFMVVIDPSFCYRIRTNQLLFHLFLTKQIHYIYCLFNAGSKRKHFVRMLCTRMQLTERRFRIKSSISCQSGDGEYESRATVSSESRSPFVRPCALKNVCVVKMFDNDSVNGKESINSSRSTNSSKSNQNLDGTGTVHQTDIHGSQTNLER